jgi:hypothetical protein
MIKAFQKACPVKITAMHLAAHTGNFNKNKIESISYMSSNRDATYIRFKPRLINAKRETRI